MSLILTAVQESSETIYDQLERTVSELNALKLKHQQLESKNLLLEKCLRLEHNQKIRQASQEVKQFACTLSGAKHA